MMKVTIKGFDELIRNMEGGKDLFYIEARKALSKSVSTIQPKAVDKAVRDTGQLKGSIRKTVKGLTGEVIAGAKHAIFIEEGTRPHFPPVSALRGWAGRKLGNPDLAYAVALKIAKVGTEPKPFMEPALMESLPSIERNFSTMADNLVRGLAK